MATFVDINRGEAPKSFARRDHLRAIEIRMQSKWDEGKLFEPSVDETKEKFMVTFPYPYMNGRLHLGHAFSVTKAEFTARFQKMLGKNVLFPFGFHCTGMPIQAAANKLKEEIATYGFPPKFPEQDNPIDDAVEQLSAETDAAASVAAKGKGKKTKLVAKGQGGKQTRQYDIMTKMVKESEVPQFTDPKKWLEYFPPYGIQDLKCFGSAIDWRRSFITTAENPFYDAFIRWQFRRLKEGGRIKSGNRPNIYSIKDGQTCADHDRSSGEGVGPQEYTLIKLEVIFCLTDNPKFSNPAFSGKKVFLAAATLRPETMYGQTNCFVLPEGEYGAYLFNNDEVFIISERSASGLAHQGFAREWGKLECLEKFTGMDLMGLPVKAPNSSYEVVYTLPLTTISMSKGTGVVTSVPSDAPDDYVALKELKDKPLWREKFGIQAHMVEPFDVVPVIDIPGYGSNAAVQLCEKHNIVSSKEKDKLKLVKDEVYLKGFYEGVLLVGECKGLKVCDAKGIIKANMLSNGDAAIYYEPESTVISRSGDECIVALTDQWYLGYGEADWRDCVMEHVSDVAKFNSYNIGIRDALLGAVDWLKEWACSREFGLGTQLPWDEKWVIDSLSDSTIYMAYYTIAKFFHGKVENLAGIHGECDFSQFNDIVFDYVFLSKDIPEGTTNIPPLSLLDEMRKEFKYWYPFDLRVSAKDLIPNHLTMCLYNHAEIWKDSPQYWPKGIYCNGHVMVDAEKMSKSKGNFLMLLECVEEFSADATRFALADAGDSLEDSNFDRSVANQAITYLFIEVEWILSVLDEWKANKLRSGELSFMDRAFDNEMDYLIEATKKHFNALCFRDGLHKCWYDMIIARDIYRDFCIRCGVAFHSDIIMRFVRSLILMMQPICPHWSDYLYEKVFDTVDSSYNAPWPAYTQYNAQTRKEYSFLKSFVKNIRQLCVKQKGPGFKKAKVFVADGYEVNKQEILKYMQTVFPDGKFSADFIKGLKSFIENDPALKRDTKILMQFGSFMKNEAEETGVDALQLTVPFDQFAILQECAAYIKGTLNLDELEIHAATSVEGSCKKKAELAVPGKPSFHLE